MELKGEQPLPVGQQRAWEALNDIELLQACVPGCESMTRTAQDTYAATVNASIGPVRARFKGSFSLSDVKPPDSYTLSFDGSGGASGFVRGQARVQLRADGPERTLLVYTTNAQVGGRLAQIGSRLVDAAAGAMSEKFFAAFSERLAPAAAAAQAPARLGFWSLLWAFLRRLFGGR